MKKQFIAVLLALCLVLSMSVAVCAEEPADPVAQIGDKTYTTLVDAIDAVKDTSKDNVVTITLLKDVTLEADSGNAEGIAIDKAYVTFDGNGKTIKVGKNYKVDSPVIAVSAENVTVKNVTIDGTHKTQQGTFAKKVAEIGIEITDAGENAVLSGVTVNNCKTGVKVADDAKITGLKAAGNTNGVIVNGTNIRVVMTDSAIDATDKAVDVTSGTAIIEGGTFKGSVTETSGKLIITGGTFSEKVAKDTIPSGMQWDGSTSSWVVEKNTAAANVQVRNAYYETLADAVIDNDYLEDGDTVKLLQDVAAPGAIAKDITLDLNGKTITGKLEFGAGNQVLTGKGAVKVTTDAAIEKKDDGVLKIDGANVTGDVTGTAGTIKIAGGDFKGSLSGSIIVTGGTFSVKPDDKMIPSGMEASGSNDSGYTIKTRASYVAKIDDACYATVDDAAEDALADEVIVLTKDLKLTKQISINGSGVAFTIDGDGKTITIDDSEDAVKDNNYGFNVTTTGSNNALIKVAKGTVTLKNVVLDGGYAGDDKKDEDGEAVTDNYAAAYGVEVDAAAGTTTLEGVTIKNCKENCVSGIGTGTLEVKSGVYFEYVHEKLATGSVELRKVVDKDTPSYSYVVYESMDEALAAATVGVDKVWVTDDYKTVYSITVNDPANGKVEVDAKAYDGQEDIPIEVTLDDGYQVASKDGITGTWVDEISTYPVTKELEDIDVDVDNNSATFTMPAGNVTLSVKVEATPFDITNNASTSGGSVTVDPEDMEAVAGETVTITANPKKTYKVKDLEVTYNDSKGKKLNVELTAGENGTYTFTMPAADVEISGSFAKAYDVIVKEPVHGKVNVDPIAYAEEVVTITTIPDERYEAKLPVVTYVVKENGKDVTKKVEVTAGKEAGTYTFTMPEEGVLVGLTDNANKVTVSVEFAEKTYNVVIGKNIANGAVTADKTEALVQDTVVTLTAAPAEGYELKGAPIVMDSKGNLVALTANENGTYSFAMPASNVSVNANFGVITVTPDPEPDEDCNGGKDCPSRAFTDLDPAQWYHNATDYVIVNKLMQGVGDKTFAPNGNLTRAMLVQVLYNNESRPAVTGSSAFTDVNDSDWFAAAVKWAADNKIVDGMGDGTFAPNADITREQMVTILYRYAQFRGENTVAAKADLTDYSDAAQISDWAKDAFGWAVENKVIQGMGDNTLAPKANATRAQVAQVLKNYLDR